MCKRTCDKHEREEEETEREKDKGEIRLFLYPCAHMFDGVREGEEEEKEKRKRDNFFFRSTVRSGLSVLQNVQDRKQGLECTKVKLSLHRESEQQKLFP